MLRDHNLARPSQIEMKNAKSTARFLTSKSGIQLHGDHRADKQHTSTCSGAKKVSVRAVMCRGNENRGIDEQIHYREEGCSLASASKKRCRERVIRRLATLSSIANRTASPSVSAFKSRCSSFTLRRSTITSFCAIDLFAAFPMDTNPFSSFSMIRTSLVKVKHQMTGQGVGISFRGISESLRLKSRFPGS